MRKSKPKTIYLVLHNIRSVYNVGAIFRTADAVGVNKIYLTGYTPAPLDRFGQPRKDMAKAALGAERNVAWESVKSPSKILSKLKSEKFYIIGLEQDKRARDYKIARPKQKTVLVLGNEVLGLSKNLRGCCDELVEIPMRGRKESLNVSVAAGIAMYRLFDR